MLKDKTIIGNKFKYYRKLKGLTQFELAEKVALNEKQISRIESGQNFPTYLTFAKLVEVLNIDINEFNEEKELINDDASYRKILDIVQSSNKKELKLYAEVLKTIQDNFID